MRLARRRGGESVAKTGYRAWLKVVQTESNGNLCIQLQARSTSEKEALCSAKLCRLAEGYARICRHMKRRKLPVASAIEKINSAPGTEIEIRYTAAAALGFFFQIQ